jgi:hypothetical protein
MSSDTTPSPLRQPPSAETTGPVRIPNAGGVRLVPSSSTRGLAFSRAHHPAAAFVRKRTPLTLIGKAECDRFQSRAAALSRSSRWLNERQTSDAPIPRDSRRSCGIPTDRHRPAPAMGVIGAPNALVCHLKVRTRERSPKARQGCLGPRPTRTARRAVRATSGHVTELAATHRSPH